MIPASPRAAERIERFVREGGAIVTTGQQTGFLTGPLYTVSKAVTAVRLADLLERAMGCVVLPVFWAASDDHDFAEVRTAWLQRGGMLTTVTLEEGAAGSATVPMAERTLANGLDRISSEIRQAIGDERDGRWCIESFEAAYGAGRTVADGFLRLLRELLAPLDLVLTDAAHPVIRDAARPIVRVEIERRDEINAAMSEHTVQLEERAGAAVQVPILPGGLNLFLRTRTGRERLFSAGERGVVARESGLKLDVDELWEMADRTPERFSPNVLLRPVVEAEVFAPLAYVAGPAEIAYLAQTGPLFERHRVARPLVFPRASFTLVEAEVRRTLDLLGLDLSDLAAPRSELWERVVRAKHLPALADRSRTLRREISEAYERYLSAGDTNDLPDDARRRIAAIRDRAISGAHRAERAVVRSVKARADTDRQRLERVLSALRPLDSPQERVLNIMPFLARHGPDLIERMAAVIDLSFLEADRRTSPAGRVGEGG